MTNTLGLVGSLGAKLKHDTVETKLKKIDVEVMKKDSDVVPKYVVAAKASDIPGEWSGAAQMPKQWLQAMMDIKPVRDLAWIDPEEWKAKNDLGGQREEREEREERMNQERREEAKKKEEEEAKARKQKQAADDAAKAKADTADAEAKDDDEPAKATDTTSDSNKPEASRSPAEAGGEKDKEPQPTLKQESAEQDLTSIPDSSSASSATSTGTSTSASPKPSGPTSTDVLPTTESKSPSPSPPNAQPSGPSDTRPARMTIPEQKNAEQEAISAVKKARLSQAELKKAEDEAMKAADRAESARIGSVDYMSDEGHLGEDPRRFLIPAEYRDENTEAWGEIMYNTDNGFLLVYEKWGKFYRGYLFSGSEIPAQKKRFLENGGETLICEPIIKSGGRKVPDIFETEVEAIAVMWTGGRVYRAMITLRDPEKPGKVLLYNITGLRAKYGEVAVAKRLRAEFLMRGQEPIWAGPRTTRVSKDETAYMAFLRKYSSDISKGKRAIQIVEIKKEDGDNEFELQEEELAVL
ncbi:hypothetical protein Forpi1262_v014544 [Fusarium oxysporum f. sp. raphani]|uniref:Uncharacterized protein n=1 Tax=Fusarium oxysporum f. sp. raphani TaxID=96318 RepID=A0A8J5U8C4_FUSOX|nr:hypothetical protein Forpi1262_v014544 [Fusarium oxysporum f. sp. raphani]